MIDIFFARYEKNVITLQKFFNQCITINLMIL
jgi:hypothetical protein